MTETPPLTFEDRVLAALTDAEASDFCHGCGEQSGGFAGWQLPPEPGVVMGLSGGALLVATLICRRCGCLKQFSLAALGIRIETPRIYLPGSGH
jgi:hypothetical protein